MARAPILGRSEIQRLQRSLDDVFARADSDEHDLEVRGDLARYACLRLAGFLEQTLLSLGRHCAGKMSGGQAQAFAMSHLRKSFNPSSEAILKFIGRFDVKWRAELEDLFGTDELGQTISAVVGIRNELAHGKDQSVSIGRLREYRKKIDQVVGFLLEKFARC